MSKQYFWPLTIILFGAVISGTALGYLPLQMLIVWAILMLIVGLGALVTADREEWIVTELPASKHASKSKHK